MELYIDLNRQAYKKKHRVLFRTLGIISSLIFVGWVAISFMEGMSAYNWFNSIYLLSMSIFLFSLGYGKSPIDLFGKAYIKINDEGIIYKSSVFRNKLEQYNWSEVEDIKIKLFEVELKINDKWVSIDLEKFTDDNLKAIKEAFKSVQSKIADREIFVA